MSDIAKTITRLKKLHQKYTDDVRTLAAKEAEIAAKLADANEKALQTAEAIAALEGKPQFTKLLQDALKMPAAALPNVDYVAATDMKTEIPESGNAELPPPEPGMKWAVNDVGEDVLVPIVMPAPRAVPGVTQVDIHLPPVAEDGEFEDPTSFF